MFYSNFNILAFLKFLAVIGSMSSATSLVKGERNQTKGNYDKELWFNKVQRKCKNSNCGSYIFL